MTPDDEFTARLARVRARFAAALDGKIADSCAALEKISGGGETIEAVITAHRRLHVHTLLRRTPPSGAWRSAESE